MLFRFHSSFAAHRLRFLRRSSGHGVVTLVLALAAGSGLAFGGMLWRARGSLSPTPERVVPDPPVGDTVVVYGPRRFDTPTGGAAYHVERFAVTVTPGRRYTLRVANGAPDGSGRVSGGSVVLNGWEVLSSAELAAGGPGWTRVVQPRSSDTLQVTVEGPAGAQVTVSLDATADASFLVFGSERFVRTGGAPVTEARQFSVPPTAAPAYRLCLVNGNEDGTQRISSASVVINGQEVVSAGEFSPQVASLSRDVSLHAGDNVLSVTLAAQPSGFLDLCVTATDTTPPVPTIKTPQEGLITRDSLVVVSGTVQDETETEVTVNGVVAARTGEAYEATVPLPDAGSNLISVSAKDAGGHTTTLSATVQKDRDPPSLTVTWPPATPVYATNQDTITVSGTVYDASPVTVNANGIPLPVDGAGAFAGLITLTVEGLNYITVTATDAAGNSSTEVRNVRRDTQAPVMTISEPADGYTTTEDTVRVTLTVADAEGAPWVTVTANGQPLSFVYPNPNLFTGVVSLAPGPNTLTIVATDGAGNSSTDIRTVTRLGALPPDPSTVAPPIDMTVATTAFAATQFLYTGSNPIQTGVDSGTIDPVRVAVLRGRVLDRAGQPVSGVTVNILDHPELGQTLSREDGRFDVAVNGGGLLTVNYQKAGLLPVQRTVDVPWQDYLPVDDVVMIGLDTAVTTIDFTQPIEVHRGTVQTDSDGTRQATLLFKQGTTAQMVMPDGSTQPIASLHVRATEYTVGPNGPQAMPAELPPTSAYTYAVELSADEAIAAGAREVRFSQPVSLYVENFLGFPVGMAVPMGSYDATQAAWLPEPNGRVVKIVSVTNGLADLDITGDDVADDATPLGVTEAEREALASHYAVGQVLWRGLISHFSRFDCNYPWVWPPGARAPNPRPPKRENGPGGGKQDEPCRSQRSIIECQNQVLGERIGVVGTPFTLNYRSDRVPGRVSGRELLLIPLTGDSLPPGIAEVDWQVEIAGRVFGDSLTPAPNLTARFLWDGKDAYGRVLQGLQVATVRITYLYPVLYQAPAPADPSFGLPGSNALWLAARDSAGLQIERHVTLGNWDARAQGLGGWTLDRHHAYDPIGGVLYLGDGSRRSANSLGQIITTVAGSGVGGYSGDGGPADSAALWRPLGVAVGPDGSLYIADSRNNIIRKVAKDGTITTVAGIPGTCTLSANYNGDGVPATEAQLSCPRDVALAADGTLYIADADNYRVRRVGTDGIITTFAGTGVGGFSGDGDRADSAQLGYPTDLVLAPDGGLYIADLYNYRVRRVGPDGIIHTVAGDGFPPFYCQGDTVPATEVELYAPGLALASDGTLYMADQAGCVRRVTPDGIISTVVSQALYPDAYPIQPYAVDLDADGFLYIADGYQQGRVWRLSPDGVLTTITAAAGEDTAHAGDGGPPAAAVLDPTSLASGPDGTLYLAVPLQNQIRAIVNTLPTFHAGDLRIASADGSEFYHFDPAGRHLRTLDALTGRTRFTFAYDSAGVLSSVTDASGNTTSVERDASGAATAIVAPFGQRTALTVDTVGYLVSLTNPAGEGIGLTYQEGGLLDTLTDARGNVHAFVYDSLGWLLRDGDPAGGFTQLARTELANGFEVSKSSALGRTTTYRVENDPNGTQRRTDTSPAGLVSQAVISTDGSVTGTSPDSTVTTVVQGPDPRAGMQAGILKTMTTRLPSGLTSTVTGSRHDTLTNRNDPFSLVTQTDSLIVNGRAFVNTLNAVQRTFSATTPEGRTSSGLLDSLGRVIAEVVPGVDTVKYVYDAQGRLAQTSQGSRTWRYTYDVGGRLDSVIDPLLRATTFAYDSAGRVLQQTLPDGRVVGYAYDSSGNLTSVTPPGRPAHAFTYTPVDLTASYHPPTVAEGATPTGYEYNVDRQLTRILRPDGDTLAFAYDSAGRPENVSHRDGSLIYGYSAVGNLASVQAPAESLGFSYDGSLLTGVTWAGAVPGSVTATYNADFQVSALTVNGSALASFGYDNDGLLTQAGDLTVHRAALNGRIDSTSLGAVTTAETYDPFGQWATRTAAINGSQVYRAEYTRDVLGRDTLLVEVLQGDTTVFVYRYDQAGRLAEVRTNGVVTASYDYDDNGNRLSVTRPNGQEIGTYDAQDRLLSYGNATYGYTKAGELRFKAEAGDTTWYHYDALGNLLEVTLPDGTDIAYVVDGLNRRVGKKVNGVLVQGLLYQDQLNPVAELDGAGTVVSRFVYGTRPNVPDYMVKNDTVYRIVTDHLGSVRVVIRTADGAVVQRVTYDEFGRELANTNVGLQPFGYAGGLADEQTGLVRFGARDYHVETGRWSTKDPVGFNTGEAGLYMYVSDDPVDGFDPRGLCRIEVRFKSILWGVANHAYILTTDLDSTRTYFRGGPGRHLRGRKGCTDEDLGLDKSFWGNLVTESAPYLPSTPDYQTGEPPSALVLDNGAPCGPYNDAFTAILSEIQDARIGYSPLGPNSNTIISVTLLGAGMFPPAPPKGKGVWAPGYYPHQ